MSKVICERGDIVAIADAVRSKTGSNKEMTLRGIVSGINEIGSESSSGGGDIDALIDGSITEITSGVNNVNEYKFYRCENLTSANFPSATIIEDYAFADSSNFVTIHAPKITSIGISAFNNCTKLEEIDFPLVTSIGSAAFSSCKKITTANFPIVTTMSGSAFQTCINLTSANFPSLKSIGSSAFASCSNLTTINFPIAESISGNAFQHCNKLVSVKFPLVKTIGSYSFYRANSLEMVDFPLATSINTNALNSCYSLKTVILRSETLCTLGNVGVLTNCYHFQGTQNATYNPNGLKDGYIYVPSALVESYKIATNWSDYATQFRALEDYTIDGTITGELDESKI